MKKMLILSIAIVFLAAGVSAATIYVDDVNDCGAYTCNSTSISGGLALAGSGDTVYVFNGTYIEDPAVADGINLTGESNTGTVVSGTITINASTVVNNLMVTGSGTGIYVDRGKDNQVISNNIIVKNSGIGIYVGDSGGTNAIITNNLIADNTGNGVHLYYDYANIYLTHNTIVNNSHGVAVGRRSTTWLTDNIIAFNRAYAFTTSGDNRAFMAPWDIKSDHSLIYGNKGGLLAISVLVFDDLGGNNYSHPMFVDANNGDYRVDCDSPANGTASDSTNIGFYQGCVDTSNYYGPFYVAKTGDDTTGNGNSTSPFRTIERGLNQTLFFDEVIVKAGTYTEDPIISDTITLSGEDNMNSIINGTVNMSGNTNMNNMKVTGPGAGIIMKSNVVIDSCRVESNSGPGIATTQHVGAEGSQIIDTLIANNAGHGAYLRADSGNNYFTRVTVANNTGNAFDIERRASVKLTDSIVANNGGYLIGGALDDRPHLSPWEILVNYSLIYEDPILADSRIDYVEIEGVVNDSSPMFYDNTDYGLSCNSTNASPAIDSASGWAGSGIQNMGWYQGEAITGAGVVGGCTECNDGLDNDDDSTRDYGGTIRASADTACTSASFGSETCIDSDGDGYNSTGGGCGPADCNDNNNSIYPGAPEVCDNAVDDNCNNWVDCIEAECTGDPYCIGGGAGWVIPEFSTAGLVLVVVMFALLLVYRKRKE